MSTKKHQQDLNISGFSPLRANSSSPSITKSPLTKDLGIHEAIGVGRDKIIAGYEKWNIACTNGHQYISQIHNIKERARRSIDESTYLSELKNYCEKLELVRRVLNDVIRNVETFKAQIKSSINILESMKDDAIKCHLIGIDNYLLKLIGAYEENFKMKSFVIENIAHTASTEQSHFLVAAWTCNSSNNVIFKLVNQLKISPHSFQWT